MYSDGWLQQDARFLVAGGPAEELTVRAEVTAAAGRHLVVVVNGRPTTVVDAPPGPLDLRIPVGPSPVSRLVELRWSATSRIGANDPRQAAALLKEIAIRSVRAPAAVHPSDLAESAATVAGIYKDGWLRRNARLLLAGGPATTLTVQTEATVKSGQHVAIFVNGSRVLARPVKAGQFNVTASLPASSGPRLVEFQWLTASRIGPSDPRTAAALLQLVAVGRVAPAAPGAPTTTPAKTNTTAPSPGTHLRAIPTRAQEVPAPAGTPTQARGAFAGDLTEHALHWRLTVSALSGPVVAAVIRAGAPGTVGDRIVTLCEPCSTPASGTIVLTPAQAERLANGPMYVNAGTPSNPGGEIRGEIRRS